MSSADVNGIKMFLNSWLGKRKLGTPNYETRQENRGNSIRFKCELRVPNFPYTAIGNSTSKKDAMTNAAMDFCQYLVREGKLHASELPSMKNEFLESSLTESNAPGSSFFGHGAPAPAPAPRLPWSNNAYMRDEQGHKEHMAAIADDISQSEAVDLKAGLHGNWTAENSKAALNEFLQKMRLPAIVYKTQIKETNLTKTFVSEASVYLPNMMKTDYTGRGQGSTKKYAESLCAANIVKQFFHLGIIQPYSGPRKKAETKTMPRIDVDVNPDLSERVRRFVENSGVAPVTVDVDSTTPEAPCSLLVDHKLAQFPDSEASVPSNVSWTPPLPNWNPWQCANIDAPPLSIMSLHEISEKISEKENAKLQMFEHQKMNEARKQLPVYQHRSRIIETVRDNQVTLIKGETGCGKSTQYILESYVDDGRGAEFSAVVSQPRRISAISLAERVAAEKSEILGETVGYGVRFENVSPRPYGSIKFCTVGTLLRMMENGLRGISHVIIDEIHERDIDTDFVLIVLRDMISTFKHLRVILMSATIDTDLFTEYFNKCPIITMEGRTFAVKHFFLENIMQNLKFIPEAIISKKKKSADDEEEVDDKSRNMNLLEGGDVDPNLRLAMSRISEKEIPFDIIVEILKKINGDALPGAVLIFLPGWADIMTLLGMLSENPEFQDTSRYELLPLHSQLTSTDQRKVFDHYEQKRKIILSTNIAETSITIDDVVFVIDSCKVKERMYTSSNNMVHFATVWASKTNIVQRRGRAGRVSAGYAFHLCSTQRFNALDEHSTAEMLRIPLHQIALNIKLLRLGSVGGFLAKAIEPPPYDMVVESEAVLQNISALDKNLELTDLGRMLARLPIDPMIGKVLVLGSVLGIGSLMCDVASAMSFSTPFVPRERFHTRLSNQQRSFAGNKYSDHVALVAVTQAYRDAEQSGFQGAKGFCERYSLSQTVCKVTSGARRQLVDLLKFSCGFPEDCLYDIQIDPHGKDRNLDLMISLLITALYPNVCFYQEKRKVYTIEQAPALLSKFSVLMGVGVKDLKLPSPLLVFKEKVRTRCVSCKELSLVSPIQLMLFGSRKVECIGADTIRLDDMITLKMDVNVAALIVALRPSIEALLVRSCQNPQSLLNAPQGDHELKDLLCELSSEKLMAEAGAVEDVLLTTAAKGASQISMRPSRGAGAHNSWGFGDLGSGGLPPNNDAWNSGSSESSDAGGKIFSPPRFPTAAPHPYNGNYRGASAPPIAPWTPTEQGFGYNRGFSGGNGGFGGNRGFGGYRGSRGFSDGNRGFNSRGGYRGGQRGRFRGGNNWGF